MYCTYSFEDSRFGIVEVLERRNCRGLSLRVFEDGKLRVTVRPDFSEADVRQYVADNAEWIEHSRQRMLAKATKVTIFSPDKPFSIVGYNLQMQPTSPNQKVYLSVRGKIISVRYPSDIDPTTNDVVQELTRKGIAYALKKEGEKVLPERLHYLAQRHGFKYNGVELKNLKSKWGSCSSSKHIVLNVQLMRLPQNLIDHVLLHELCHTIELNHGPKFHALLNKVENGLAEQHDDEMKHWKTQLW